MLLSTCRDNLADLPLRLRDALRWVLRSRPYSPALDGPGPIRSLADLAAQTGVCRGYLSRLASEAAFDLQEVNGLWRLALALHLRQTWRVPWEVVAWRIGYRSHAGLAALARRATGLTLTELEDTYVEGLFDLVAERLGRGA